MVILLVKHREVFYIFKCIKIFTNYDGYSIGMKKVFVLLPESKDHKYV